MAAIELLVNSNPGDLRALVRDLQEICTSSTKSIDADFFIWLDNFKEIAKEFQKNNSSTPNDSRSRSPITEGTELLVQIEKEEREKTAKAEKEKLRAVLVDIKSKVAEERAELGENDEAFTS